MPAAGTGLLRHVLLSAWGKLESSHSHVLHKLWLYKSIVSALIFSFYSCQV